MKRFLVNESTYIAQKEKLDKILSDIEKNNVILSEANQAGDLSENALWEEAKSEQQRLSRKRNEALEKLARMRVVDPPVYTNEIGIGSVIDLKVLPEGRTVTKVLTGILVGNGIEVVDGVQRGQLSIESEVGKAVFGKSDGDTFSITNYEGKIINYQVNFHRG